MTTSTETFPTMEANRTSHHLINVSRRPRNSSRALWLSVVLVGVTTLAGGCSPDSSKAAQKKLAAASAERSGGGASTNIVGNLREVVADGSSVTKAQANSIIGQLSLKSAAQAYADWAANQADITRLSREIADIARTAASTQSVVAASASLDPKPVLDELAKATAAARGEGNAPLFIESAQGGIASLSATRLNISELESKIAQTKQKLEQFTAERDGSITKADALAQAAQGSAGDAKLDQLKQAASIRDSVGEVSRQIADATATLAGLTADLSAQTALAKSLDATISSFSARTQQTSASWTEIQTQLAAQSDQAKALISGPDAAVVKKALELSSLVTSSKAAEGELIKFLEDAAGSFASAASAARDFETELTAAPAGTYAPAVLENIRKTISPVFYRLEEIEAKRFIASVHRQSAQTLLARRIAASVLSPALVKAGASLPVEVDADAFSVEKLTQQLQVAVDASNTALTDAQTQVETVTAGNSPLQNAAKIVRAYVLYEQALLGRLAGVAGVAPELVSKTDQLIADAKAQIGDARTANVRFGRPPAEIDSPAASSEAPAPAPEAPASPAPETPAPETPAPTPAGAGE